MKTKLTLLTVGTAFTLWACGTTNSDDTTTRADSANEAMAENAEETDSAAAVAEADARFAVDAANGGLAEVQLGKIAQDKGVSPKVKEFGKMMVEDHAKANEELKALAASKNITLPSAPNEEMQKAAGKIGEKNGKDFDKAYIDQMVKDHDKTVKLFEDGQKDVKDPDLKAFIDKTLPVLKTHQEHVKGLDKAD